MRKPVQAIILAAVFALSAAGQAVAVVDGPVSKARELVEAGKPAEAYQLLAPMASTRAGDPDFDYMLGLAAVDARRPVEAIVAFQRVLAVQPNNAPARAELARAYALAGDAETARREFGAVVGDPTIPDPVRRRFNAIIGGLDRSIADGGRSITGFVEAGAGYDTNVNTATDQSSMVIPLFAGLGPAALSSGATESEDAYGQLAGGISLLQNLDRQNRVFLSALGSVRANMDEEQFNTTTATATAGYAHTFANRSVGSASAQLQEFWLSGDRYRSSRGIIGQYTVPLNGAALSASIQYFDVSYPTDAIRDGDRMSAGLSYTWASGIAGLQFGKEDVDSAAGQHFSNDFGGVSAALEFPLFGRATLISSLSGEYRKYDAADPLFLVVRDDRQIDASLTVRLPLGGFGGAQLTLRPQVTYTNNDSNIALYKYDRLTGSVTLRAEF